jgi:hypothetical protein
MLCGTLSYVYLDLLEDPAKRCEIFPTNIDRSHIFTATAALSVPSVG